MFGVSGSRTAGCGAVCVALASLAWVSAAPANDIAPRVPRSYFGANFTPTPGMSMAEQEAHFERMVANGIRQIRVDVPWNEIERHAPQGGTHSYDWDSTDKLMAALARAGARPNVVISNTPRWAQTDEFFERLQCNEQGIRTRRPVDLDSYALATGAVARRYGRGGNFWEGKDFAPRPISRYYIWNEQNTYPNWCPAPNPEAYVYMLMASADQIRAADPLATVIPGGMPGVEPHSPPAYLAPGDFLGRMTAARPDFPSAVDAIGVNVFWFASDQGPLERLAWYREELRRGNVPDSEPMLVTEFGWPTAGPLAFTEAERTSRLRQFSRRVPRTNCNVLAASVHTWITPQLNGSDSEDWFGIADPVTADLFPIGAKYVDTIAVFRGKSTRPPRKTQFACNGMPAPDQDADGVIDQDDRYPLNPMRS